MPSDDFWLRFKAGRDGALGCLAVVAPLVAIVALAAWLVYELNRPPTLAERLEAERRAEFQRYLSGLQERLDAEAAANPPDVWDYVLDYGVVLFFVLAGFVWFVADFVARRRELRRARPPPPKHPPGDG